MLKDIWVEKFQIEALPVIIKNFKPDKVLLFGSRVKGKAAETSDLDVIIISNFFEGIPFVKRMSMVLKTARFPKHVDYLCYTPDEFEKIQDSSSVIQEALEECLEVA